MNLEPREVEYHWQRLLLHQARFPAGRGRKIDLRTAAFDYFLNETNLLVEPLVMEREALRRTELMAYFDHLTGLHNYAYFESEIKTEVARAKRYDTSLCLLLVDLDDFKLVNDTLGHRAGNDVLREVGHLLRKRLRSSDLVALFGGDEFAALLHRTDAEDGRRVADNLCVNIDQQLRQGSLAQLERPVTASFGLSALPIKRKTKCSCSSSPTKRCIKRSARAAIAWSSRSHSLRGWRTASSFWRVVRPDEPASDIAGKRHHTPPHPSDYRHRSQDSARPFAPPVLEKNPEREDDERQHDEVVFGELKDVGRAEPRSQEIEPEKRRDGGDRERASESVAASPQRAI